MNERQQNDSRRSVVGASTLARKFTVLKKKVCTKCHKRFPATTKFFPKCKATKSGLGSWCKRCARAKSRAWDAAHRERAKALQKARLLEHPLYEAWVGMRQRCFNKNHHAYRNYGARGVTICPHWQDFKTFEKDMSPRPKGKTLGCYLDTGDYTCPRCGGNATWQTWSEQGKEHRTKGRLRRLKDSLIKVKRTLERG